jgi:GH24 family phage-related lysozyme (muramidase)
MAHLCGGDMSGWCKLARLNMILTAIIVLMLNGWAMDSRFLDTIKRFEGFAAQAKWDYAQFTNGYGTKALHPGETVSKLEADRRFQKEIADAARLVDRFSPNLDPGTRAALTSLTFNAGPKWMSAGLGQAIKSGNFDEGRQIFLQYNKAGGEVLPGLVRRRLEEANWFGSMPAAPAGPNSEGVEHANLTVGDWTTITSQKNDPTQVVKEHLTLEKVPEAMAMLEQVKIEQWRLLAFDLDRTGPDDDKEPSALA